MTLSILFILLGFFLLYKGGDFLVEGAVSLARIARLSPMVIGMTVVGFGTSAPELLVSVQAALAGSPGIAIGNVVGSNIANIALILGLTALIAPLPATQASLRTDLPFMSLSVALLSLAGLWGTIHRWEGLLALLLLAVFMGWQVVNSRRHPQNADGQGICAFRQHGLGTALLIVAASGLALVFGARLLVMGATDVAMLIGTQLGVERGEMERVIGLTVVAVGTSLPELFATVMSARKGQSDIALGNIIGSVTFNILCVVGAASAIAPIHGADRGFLTDYAVMTGLAALLLGFMYARRCLNRGGGLLLLALYLLYLARTCMV